MARWPDHRSHADLSIDKAVRELAFELAHRPDWVHIPLRGLVRLMRAWNPIKLRMGHSRLPWSR